MVTILSSGTGNDTLPTLGFRATTVYQDAGGTDSIYLGSNGDYSIESVNCCKLVVRGHRFDSV